MKLADVAVAELLRKSGQEIESEVSGDSMVPTLTPGARIRIRYGASYRPGDIVAILGEPQIAHRVVSIERRGSKRYLMTRGDGLWYADPPVAEDLILGVVTAQLRDGQWQAPGPSPKPRGWPAMLGWLSECGTRAALKISEPGAIFVARSVTKVAMKVRHRA